MTLKELEAKYPGIKEWSAEDFASNECHTDEYRETQPTKGLAFLADYWELFEAGLSPQGDPGNREREALRLLEAWVHRMNNPQPEDYSYAGAEQLYPLLLMYHDDLWDQAGRHPYDNPGDESDYFDEDRIKWFLDDRKAAEAKG
jgi:hypothetical protein